MRGNTKKRKIIAEDSLRFPANPRREQGMCKKLGETDSNVSYRHRFSTARAIALKHHSPSHVACHRLGNFTRFLGQSTKGETQTEEEWEEETSVTVSSTPLKKVACFPRPFPVHSLFKIYHDRRILSVLHEISVRHMPMDSILRAQMLHGKCYLVACIAHELKAASN